MSTGEIGLAKLKEGIILVRIGEPVFPEYASWRYGRMFVRRDRTSAFSAQAGGAAVLATLLLLGGPLLAISGAGATAYVAYRLGKVGVRRLTGLHRLGPIPLADGSTQTLNVSRARRARVVATEGGGWTLALPEFAASTGLETVDDVLSDEEIQDGFGLRGGTRRYDLVAPAHAEAVARRVMPVVNAAGGDDDMVRGASKLHEQWEGRIGETVSKLVTFQRRPMQLLGEPHLSLAFEMSVYEDQERRWLQTELYLLKAAWKEAERLAAIADDLALPEWLDERIAALRKDGSSQTPAI